MYVGGRLTPAQFWEHVAQLDATIRTEFPTFPVYGLRSWPDAGSLAGWGHENDVLTSAGFRYGDEAGPHVHVHTTRADPFETALSIRFSAGGRAGREDDFHGRWEALRSAPSTTTTIRVDGTPVDFTTWHTTDTWYAATALDSLGLILEWQGVDPSTFSLTRIDDIEPYLESRRADLRRRRGE